MCDSKLPADDSHEQASRLSALDLYEDLLIKEDSQDGNRVLSMQEIMMEKRTLQEQNTLLLQQLMESKLQSQKLLDEKTNLKKNFESLLATAKVELQRKNDLLSRYIAGSSGTPVGPARNPTQNNPKPGTSKENNKKKGLLDLYKGRRVKEEELVAMKSGNSRIPSSLSPALLQHRGEKMVGVATRVIGSSFENIGDAAAKNLMFNSPAAGTQSTGKPNSSTSNASRDIRTSLSDPSVEVSTHSRTLGGNTATRTSGIPSSTSITSHSRLVETQSLHDGAGTSKPHETHSSDSGHVNNVLRATNTATDEGQSSTLTRSDRQKQISSNISDKTICKRKNSSYRICDSSAPSSRAKEAASGEKIQPSVADIDLRASPEVYSTSMYESRTSPKHSAATTRHNGDLNTKSEKHKNSLETEWQISEKPRKDLKSDSRHSKSRFKTCDKDDKKLRKVSVEKYDSRNDCLNATSRRHGSKFGSEESSKHGKERSKSSTKHSEKSHQAKSHLHDEKYVKSCSKSTWEIHNSVKVKSSHSEKLMKENRRSSKHLSEESLHRRRDAEILYEKQILSGRGDKSHKDLLGKEKSHQKHSEKSGNLPQKLLNFPANDIHRDEKSHPVMSKSKKHYHGSDKHKMDSHKSGSGSVARVNSPNKSYSPLSGSRKKKISLQEYLKNNSRAVKLTSSEAGSETHKHKPLMSVEKGRKSPERSSTYSLSEGEIEDSDMESGCTQRKSTSENFKSTFKPENDSAAIQADDGNTRVSLSDGEIVDSPKKEKSKLLKKRDCRHHKHKLDRVDNKPSETPGGEDDTTVSLSDGEVLDSPPGTTTAHGDGQLTSCNRGEVLDDALDLELDYDENSLMYRDLIHPDDVKLIPEVESNKDSKIHREKSTSKQSKNTEDVILGEHRDKGSSVSSNLCDGAGTGNQIVSMELPAFSKSSNLTVASPVKVSSSIISSPQYQPKVHLFDISKASSGVLKKKSLKKRKISRESLEMTPKKTKLTKSDDNDAKDVNKIYFDPQEASKHIDSGAITSTLNEISKALCSSATPVDKVANSTEESIEKQILSGHMEDINTDGDIQSSRDRLVISESMVDNDSEKTYKEFDKTVSGNQNDVSQSSATQESTPVVAAMMDVAMEVEVAPSSGVDESSGKGEDLMEKTSKKLNDVKVLEHKNKNEKSVKPSGNLKRASPKKKSCCVSDGNPKRNTRKRKLKIKMKPFVKSRRKSLEKTQNSSSDSTNAISITDVVASLPDVEDSNSVPEPPPLLNKWLSSARESRRRKRKREKELRIKKEKKDKGEVSKSKINDDVNKSFTCETVSDCNTKIKIHVMDNKRTEKCETQVHVAKKWENSFQPTLFPIVGGEGDIMKSYRNAALQWLLHMVNRKLKTINESSSDIPLDLSVKKKSDHSTINVEEKERVTMNLFSKPPNNTEISSNSKGNPTDVGFDKLLQEHKEKQNKQTGETTDAKRSMVKTEKRKPRRVALERVAMPPKEISEHSSKPNIVSPSSRTVWMSSLEKCQARRKQQARWSSEIDTENENGTTQPEPDSKFESIGGSTQILKESLSSGHTPNKYAILPEETPLGLQELSRSSVSDLIPDISSSSWQLTEESRHRFYSFAKVVKLLSPLKRSPRKSSLLEDSSL